MKQINTIKKFQALLLVMFVLALGNMAWAQQTLPQTLPYTESFDEGTLPDVWTMNKNGFNAQTGVIEDVDDGYVFQFSSRLSSPQGPLRSSFSPQYLISPVFDGSNPIKVTFRYRNFNSEFDPDDYPGGEFYIESFQVDVTPRSWTVKH